MIAAKFGFLLPMLILAGCASSGPVRSLNVAASNPGTVERNLDGTVVLRSQQTHVVSVLPLGEKFAGDTLALPSFHVIVTNGGKDNVTLELADISAESGSEPVALLNPVKLQDRLDREQAAATGWSGGGPIGAGWDASQSGEEAHGYHRRHPIAPSGPSGPPDFQVPKRVVERALERQVIRPSETGGGRIVLEARQIVSGSPLKIVVNVAGERHEFRFEVGN